MLFTNEQSHRAENFPMNIRLPNEYYTVREAMEIIFYAGGGPLEATPETKATIKRMARGLRARLEQAAMPEQIQRTKRGAAPRVAYSRDLIHCVLDSAQYVNKILNQCMGLPTTKKATRRFIQERRAAARAAAGAGKII